MHEKSIAAAEAILAEKLAKGQVNCALALIDEDGYPTTSILTISKACGLRWMTFDTGLQSNKAIRIRKDSRASVCVCAEDVGNISLVGDIEIVTDLEVKREMWYEGMEHHFSGPDDPNYCVLRFTAKRYNLFLFSQGEEAQGSF